MKTSRIAMSTWRWEKGIEEGGREEGGRKGEREGREGEGEGGRKGEKDGWRRKGEMYGRERERKE